jgi:hypothetical protein
MKKGGLYLTIALMMIVLLGLPLMLGLKIGSIIAKAWFGFSLF